MGIFELLDDSHYLDFSGIIDNYAATKKTDDTDIIIDVQIWYVQITTYDLILLFYLEHTWYKISVNDRFIPIIFDQ